MGFTKSEGEPAYFTVVVFELELFVTSGSPVVATWAELVRSVPVTAVMLMLIVNTYSAPDARGPGTVHVTVWPVAAQMLGLLDAYVAPPASVAVTVMAPVVACWPLFRILTWYV